MHERIDSHIHVWCAADDAQYPWDADRLPDWLPESEPVEKVLADMDDLGLAAAIITPPSICGDDNLYAIASARAHPARLAVLARVDLESSDPDGLLESFAAEPTVVGIRLTSAQPDRWQSDGIFEPFLRAAAQFDLPVAAHAGPEHLAVLGEVAQRHPDLILALDHLGLDAPITPLAADANPFEYLPDLLALAAHPNITVKMSAVPALSREPYPFRDIWPVLSDIVSAFGAERVMWGSDSQRTAALYSYRESLEYLSEVDVFDDATKQVLLSQTVRSVFRWPPA